MTEPSKRTRRDFLRGKTDGLAPYDEAGVEHREGVGPQPYGDPTADPYLLKIGRRAMACQFQIFVNAGQYENATEAALEALDRVDELEALLTVYRDDSEVSEINRMPPDESAIVGVELGELLAMSLRLYEMTDGAFDVTSGPISDVWAAARREGTLPNPALLERARKTVGSKYVEFDEQQQTVRLLRSGVALNFGGIGKGYALDESATILENAGVNDFLFHGGRSSVLARGTQTNRDTDTTGWTIGVMHPLRPERRLAEIRLRDRALSTSGSLTQSFTFQGQRYGHILDPRTGQPAEGVLAVTVVADTAAVADALSTALFVLGPERGVEFCQQHAGFSAIFVLPGDRAHSIQIETCNFDADDCTFLQA